MAVASDFAAWLKAPALYVVLTRTDLPENFKALALDSEIITPLAEMGPAVTAGAEQRDFLSGPLARDQLLVYGLRADLIGKLITAKGDRLGYEGAGSLAFVIGAAEQEGARMTILTVIKRLAS